MIALLAPLAPQMARLDAARFPSLADLNALLEGQLEPIRVRNGLPLRFVPQSCGHLPFEAQYELSLRIRSWKVTERCERGDPVR